MTKDQQTILLIKGAISALPFNQREDCKEVIKHIKTVLRAAGHPVGSLAIALIGAELQAENSE